jgi:hypothetical protein
MILGCGRDVHLTHPTPLTGSQILGQVPFARGAAAGRLAAAACPRSEGTSDQRPPGLENDFQLTLLLLGGFRQSLSQTAGLGRHCTKANLLWHIYQALYMPDIRAHPALGMGGYRQDYSFSALRPGAELLPL